MKHKTKPFFGGLIAGIGFGLSIAFLWSSKYQLPIGIGFFVIGMLLTFVGGRIASPRFSARDIVQKEERG